MNLITGFRERARKSVITFWNWMWLHSDVSFRRMCVMASLHAQLSRCKDDCDSIPQLNQHMKLVNDYNAMRFPIVFAPLIWKNLPSIEKLDTDNNNLVHRIMRLTPCWLYYTSEQGFEADIKQLLGFCKDSVVHA